MPWQEKQELAVGDPKAGRDINPRKRELKRMKSLENLAKNLRLNPKNLVPYGSDKGKVRLEALDSQEAEGQTILVTAMSPSPAGEGKTTVTIGLTDALTRLGKRAVAALREPSMGPVFGMKGGGAGGGKAQLYPSDEINLHFTGDFHALTSAHNLLAATIDNHLHFGNKLGIDIRAPLWERVLDVNDRSLRQITIGLGGRLGGFPRQGRFDITAASELMAVLALAEGRQDLEKRLKRLVVARSYDNTPITCADLKAHGSLMVLLKDALLPNLVQTAEGSPAVVHAGPFANIAHGTSSVLGTRLATRYADLVLQEAGFGADLGAEKFLHLFCPAAGVQPRLAVVVCTLRAMRYHAGVPLAKIALEDRGALEKGFENPKRHIENLKSWGLEPVVALNRRPEDGDSDLRFVIDKFQQLGVEAYPVEVFSKGGEGALQLAERVAQVLETPRPSPITPLFQGEVAFQERLDTIARRVYRASGVVYSKEALKQARFLEEHGFSKLGVCVAKTQYSFSADAAKVGAPTDFELPIRELRLSAGAGFIVGVAGDTMTMPGLAQEPNLEKIHLDENGHPVLF